MRAPWRRLPLEYRVVGIQLGVMLAATLGAAPFGSGVARSVALGGICAAAPNAYFAWRARRAKPDAPPLRAAAGLLLGMLQKLALTVALLWLVLDRLEVASPGAFFGAFIVVLMTHRIAPLLEPGPVA